MASDELQVSPSVLEAREAEGSNQLAIRTLDDIKRVSMIFVESGMFKADRNATEKQKLYQAGVKIIAGVEFGIQPFAAMRGINIINGNAEMSANLMAAKVKKHPKYDYRVTKLDNDGCDLTFYESVNGKKEELGSSSFTIDDARRAGLMSNPTWTKFPQNMCFARALSNGVRIHCPDVFYGAPVYTEGEISGEFESTSHEPAAEEPKQPETKQGPVEAEIVSAFDAVDNAHAADDQTQIDEEPEEDEPVIDGAAAAAVRWMTPNQRKAIMSLANSMELDKDERLSVISDAIEREVESANELSFDEAQATIEHMQALKAAS